MARRYVMKVSELQALANEQYSALAQLHQTAIDRCSEHFSAHLPYAVREALGRLDVIDMMEESSELAARQKALQDRISEYLGAEKQRQRSYWPGEYKFTSVDSLISEYQRYSDPSAALRDMPEYLREEVAQVMSEKGVTVVSYSVPSPSALVQEFKRCTSLHELKQVVTRHHAEALAALGPLLKKEEPRSV